MPDVLVLAGGSRPAPLDLAAWGNLPTAAAYEVLIEAAAVPPSSAERPILIYGGGETGTETAEFLAKAGHEVLLVTRSDRKFLARNAEALYRISLLQRLAANPAIGVLDHAQLHAINGDHVVLSKAGVLSDQPAAAILLAHGLVPDTGLSDALTGIGLPMIRIGDAVQVARIGEAVRDANRAVQEFRRILIQPVPVAC